MKLLFVTPPMGNWAPWGDRHLAVNSLHAQVAAFIREKKAADVSVLDCRALGLDDEQMLDEVKRRQPDAVFFGAMIAAAGGAAQLNRFHAAMQGIKEVLPKTITIGGGLMYTAVPQKVMAENPQLDFAIVGVFGDNEYPLWELLEELKKTAPKLGAIRGLAWRDGDEIVLNAARPVISNLDELPMPVRARERRAVAGAILAGKTERGIAECRRQCVHAEACGGRLDVGRQRQLDGEVRGGGARKELARKDEHEGERRQRGQSTERECPPWCGQGAVEQREIGALAGVVAPFRGTAGSGRGPPRRCRWQRPHPASSPRRNYVRQTKPRRA